MYLIKGHIIRLLYLCSFHFFFTVLIFLNILYSCLLSGKIQKKNTKNTFPSSANKAERMTIANCSSQVKFIVVVGSCTAKKQEVRSSLF